MAKEKALVWQNRCFLFVSGAGSGDAAGDCERFLSRQAFIINDTRRSRCSEVSAWERWRYHMRKNTGLVAAVLRRNRGMTFTALSKKTIVHLFQMRAQRGFSLCIVFLLQCIQNRLVLFYRNRRVLGQGAG